MTYVDEKAWTSLVNRQSDLWFKTDYQVVGEPDYQTNLYKKPENPSGQFICQSSCGVATIVRKRQSIEKQQLVKNDKSDRLEKQKFLA